MDHEKIGKFLRELRKEKKLSQYQLEEKTNISRTLINKIENGKSSLTLVNALFFCDFYDIDMSELIAGKRKNKNNQKYIDEAVYEVIRENNKLKKRIRYIIMTFMILVLFILLSFFVNFYCSVKVYKVSLLSNSVSVNNGFVFKTKDRIYFYLDNDYPYLDDDINCVTLFYKLKNKRQDILSQSNLSSIFFVDYNGYGEYVDFKKLDDIMDNMYIEVSFLDGTREEIKIDFTIDYVNNQIFARKYKSIAENIEDVVENKDDYNKSHLYDKVRMIYEKYKDKDGFTKIEYDNREYQISSFEEMLNMSFKMGKKEYELAYVGFNSEFFQFSKLDEGNEAKQVYSINYRTKECQYGKCETYENDIQLFEKVIDLILESDE